MEKAEIEKRLNAALRRLCTQDGHLLEVDAHERAITHRLGMYLQYEFRNWHVDCEYNRYGYDPKRLALEESQYTGERSVYPDIIIHQRGREGRNLLVIEAKKDPNEYSEEVKLDLIKLAAYKRCLKYDYAVFLKVWTGKNHQDPTICWV